MSPLIVGLSASIGELVGRYSLVAEQTLTPRLRRQQRLRSIQASLAIENNSLTLPQVTAVLGGRRVLGPPSEIQEVRNAFAAYEAMEGWRSSSQADLLEAHRLMMQGLVEEAGSFRRGGVGVFDGQRLVHLAPPATRVPHLVADLFKWLETSSQHPLVASCVVHYELEFIHPFSDGNGRMGRLWQTLILREWKPPLAFLPVETVIRDRQQAYYEALRSADHQGDAQPFVEFMLLALRDALDETLVSDQVGDQVNDQVSALLAALASGPRTGLALMETLRLSHRATFRKNYLDPALEQGLVERTEPASPRSPTQRYRLTPRGQALLSQRG